MNAFDYQDFYNRVGAFNGWDFSRVKYTTEGRTPDLYDEVVKRSKPSDLLLDIGTGGGEAVLSISDSVLLLVGIDQSTGMMETATNNLLKAKKANVRFFRMDAKKLDFPDTFFNIVSCRHSDFDASEVARVLVNDGLFLTQQVGEHDKLNIKQAFGRCQNFGVRQGTLENKYLEDLRAVGFTDIQSFEYHVTEYYESHEDLIFLLKHTPIIPNFGERESDFQLLKEFIVQNLTDKGIRTSAERFLIFARK